MESVQWISRVSSVWLSVITDCQTHVYVVLLMKMRVCSCVFIRKTLFRRSERVFCSPSDRNLTWQAEVEKIPHEIQSRIPDQWTITHTHTHRRVMDCLLHEVDRTLRDEHTGFFRATKPIRTCDVLWSSEKWVTLREISDVYDLEICLFIHAIMCSEIKIQ